MTALHPTYRRAKPSDFPRISEVGQLLNEQHTLLHPLRFARIGSACVVEAACGQDIGRALMGSTATVPSQQWLLTQLQALRTKPKGQ